MRVLSTFPRESNDIRRRIQKLSGNLIGDGRLYARIIELSGPKANWKDLLLRRIAFIDGRIKSRV